MNLVHYQQVLDQIVAHPETWDQTQWHCGTSHCFAGWAQVLSGKPADETTARRDARIYLDLSSWQADQLFHASTTLDELQAGVSKDRETYDRQGYNMAGYDMAGYDRDALDQNNRPRPEKRQR